MSVARLDSLAGWGAGITLALGLHAAAAFFLLTHWHADAQEIAGAPAILVDFAPEPSAPAAAPNELPPGPPAPHQEAEPEPSTSVVDKQVKPEAHKPAPKPEEQTAALALLPTPAPTIDVLPPERAPRPTFEVLPPPRPAETRHETPAHHRQASRASAPQSAARHAMRTAARTPGASAHDPYAVPSWRSALVARIERYKHYPDAARARGETGVAQVAFSVDRRGGVHDARIVRSSGSALLDRDALAWLHRSQPLPPPPPELRGTRIPVVVPLRYAIR